MLVRRMWLMIRIVRLMKNKKGLLRRNKRLQSGRWWCVQGRSRCCTRRGLAWTGLRSLATEISITLLEFLYFGIPFMDGVSFGVLYLLISHITLLTAPGFEHIAPTPLKGR